MRSGADDVNTSTVLGSEPPVESDHSAAEAGTTLEFEFAQKLSIIRAEIAEQGVEAAALSSRRNFAWATCGGDNHVIDASEMGVATLVVTSERAVVVTPANEARRIRDEEIGRLGIPVLSVPWESPGAADAKVARIAGGKVAIDAELEHRLRPWRMILNGRERAEMHEIGRNVARAMADVLAGVQVGDLETVVAARLGLSLAPSGMNAHVSLAASDGRILEYRHPIPKPKPIERSLMLVVCAERRGLIVAATRFVWLETPAPEIARRFAAVGRIHRIVEEATRPGVSFAALFEVLKEAYAHEGYENEWRLHHQGGAIGYQPREEFATPTSRMVVQPGMAFAWNPSISGAKAEDTMILDDEGIGTVVTQDRTWPGNEDVDVREWVRSA